MHKQFTPRQSQETILKKLREWTYKLLLTKRLLEFFTTNIPLFKKQTHISVTDYLGINSCVFIYRLYV